MDFLVNIHCTPFPLFWVYYAITYVVSVYLFGHRITLVVVLHVGFV